MSWLFHLSTVWAETDKLRWPDKTLYWCHPALTPKEFCPNEQQERHWMRHQNAACLCQNFVPMHLVVISQKQLLCPWKHPNPQLPHGFTTVISTHISLQRDVTVRPTKTPRGMALELVGSTTTVLPGDTGKIAGSLPQSKCSCLGKNITALVCLTVPILSGTSHPFQLSTLMNSDMNRSISGSGWYTCLDTMSH